MTYWVWGTGDGSTTYTMPDFRGRGRFGLDNMGGTAANRITSAGSNLNGDALGAVGGSEAIQGHIHTASSSATSTVTDPTHSHVEQVSNQNGGYGGPFPSGTNISGGINAPAYSTASAATGITVATSVSTTIDVTGTGASSNIPPAAIVATLMYVGA